MPTRPFEFIFPGIVAAQAIHAAVQFRIPDLMASGPKSTAELAASCGAHEPTLERLLRALTSIEIFVRNPDGQYRNSALSDLLRTDHPQSLRAESLFHSAPYMWLAFGELSESVRTGEPAFERALGQSFFSYLAGHPDEAAAYNRLMTLEVAWTTPALLKVYDFSRFERLVDVGGGQGAFLSLVLAATPELRGILFDQPDVITEAAELLVEKFGTRLKLVGGSFFDTMPEGADAYALRRVIHDWDDEDALRILRSVRRVIPADGTLLLVEGLVDSTTRPAGLMDIMMLVKGGRERTETAFRLLLDSAGFSLTKVIPAGAHFLIECRPS